MKKVKLTAVVSAAVLLAGCTQPEYDRQESALIIWKSPLLRYADQGFIYKAPTRTKVEIYTNGTPLLRLKIDQKQICVSFWACVEKARFNAKYLSRDYPPDTLERIFRGEAIFGGLHRMSLRNGFTQQIESPERYKIEYRVFKNETVFRDTINKILIKVIKQ